MAKRRERRKPGTGKISAEKDGSFKASYPKPGAKGYFVKRGFATAADAARWLEDLARRESEQYDITGGEQTLEAWIVRWLAAQTDIKPKTAHDYRLKLRYIIGLLGKRRLSELRADNVDAMLAIIDKTLAATTARQIRALLKRCLEDALRRGYIERNPVIAARRKAPETKQPYRLSQAEAARLIAHIPPRYVPVIRLLLLGLRLGEALGLRPSDVDPANRTITINQSLGQIGGKAQVGTPKSKAAKRTIPIPADLATEIVTPAPRLFVFAGDGTDYIYPTTINHVLRDAARAAMLPHITPHMLRHTAASWLLNAGAPEPVIAAILGHAASSITRHYARPDVETIRPWIERIAAMARAA